VVCAAVLSSCGSKQTIDTSKTDAETPAAAAPATQPAGGPHASVRLKDGSRIHGMVVASTQTDMVVAGDDGIERKIPLGQVQSVEYGEPEPSRRSEAPPRKLLNEPAAPPSQAEAPAAPPAPVVTTRTSELPAGSQLSVRVNETIDSATANEGQSFDAQVTRDARDAGGDVVIPRGSSARVVIRSASKGGRFHGASDLVLDLDSVTIDGRRYAIDTAEIMQKGNSGVGVNKRTATYSGGGAALGAIIGAIAGGGKGAAIGAGAGAGAGALTQVLTQGKAVRVPAESVLTFSLDKPLRVTAQQ
jgi:hypothetical protein